MLKQSTPGSLWGWALQGLWNWALQGVSGVGHCLWHSQGVSEVGHSRESLILGTPGTRLGTPTAVWDRAGVGQFRSLWVGRSTESLVGHSSQTRGLGTSGRL